MSGWRVAALAIVWAAACSNIDSRPGEIPVVDVGKSSFRVDHTTAEVGVDTVAVTIILRDPQGKAVKGVDVELVASGDGNELTQPRSDAYVMTATWASTKAELKHLTAKI